MKQILFLLIVPFALISAKVGSNFYIGKWHPFPNSAIPTTFTLTIKKAGDYYVMLSSEKPDEPIALKYDPKTDSMSGRLDGMHFWMQISRSGWLGMHPDQGEVVMFEKSK